MMRKLLPLFLIIGLHNQVLLPSDQSAPTDIIERYGNRALERLSQFSFRAHKTKITLLTASLAVFIVMLRTVPNKRILNTTFADDIKLITDAIDAGKIVDALQYCITLPFFRYFIGTTFKTEECIVTDDAGRKIKTTIVTSKPRGLVGRFDTYILQPLEKLVKNVTEITKLGESSIILYKFLSII
jgi:hypothetical protein